MVSHLARLILQNWLNIQHMIWQHMTCDRVIAYCLTYILMRRNYILFWCVDILPAISTKLRVSHTLLPSIPVKWLLIGNWFQCDNDGGKAEGSGVWFIVNMFYLGMKISSRLCFSGTCCIWYLIWFEKEKEERWRVLIHSLVKASSFLLLVSNLHRCQSFTLESFIY